jgi:hypothetical protein
MKTKSIRQTVRFNAAPEKIYQLILDQKKHSAFTGSKAIISTKIKGNSAFLMVIVMDIILN